MQNTTTRDEIMPNPVSVEIDGETYIGGICFGPRAEWVAMIESPGCQPSFFWTVDKIDAMRQGSDEVDRREARGVTASARLFPIPA